MANLNALCLSAVLVLTINPVTGAQEWDRFRGPNGTGISDVKNIPVQWTDSDYNWKVKLPGGSHSSPVLWGEKIFVTSCIDETATRIVLGLDAKTGSEIWRREYKSTVHRLHGNNSFASATPTVDGERLYVVWSAPEEYTIVAFDHYGNQVWSRDLGPYVSQHSCGTSPIVFEDMVFLGNDQDKQDREDPAQIGKSFLIALERTTGRTRWKTTRNSELVAYSTPCIYQPNGARPQLIFNSRAHGISSIDPWTGEKNWEVADVFNKRSCSSPVIAGDLILGSCGSGGGGNYLVGVRPATSMSEAKVQYKIDRAAPYVPTALAMGDRVFLWSDSGVVTCIEGPTGKEIWRRRVEGNFFGSPVYIDGRIHCISTDGDVVVLAAGDEYQLLARNPLGELCHTTPAVANDTLYLRTYSHLFSIGGNPTKLGAESP